MNSSSSVAQAPPPWSRGAADAQVAETRQPGPGQAAWSNATRYLCTAAHVDEDFARAALEDILHAPYRAVAPSPGYDLGVVLRHCWAARALADRTAATAVVLLGLASVLGSIPVAVALGFSALFALFGWVRRVKPLRKPGLRMTERVLLVLFAALALAALPLLVAGAVVVLPFAAAAAAVLACGLGTYLWAFGRMRSNAPLGGQAQLTARLGSRVGAAVTAWVVSGVAAALLAVALTGLLPWEASHPAAQLIGLVALVTCWVVLVRRRLTIQRNIVALHADAWDPAGAPAVPGELEALLARLDARDRDGNITFFDGSDPFFAHGSFVDGWTVPITLRPDSDSGDWAGSLTVEEVVDAIRGKLLALDQTSLPLPLRMPGLRVRDRCYASGTLVGPDPHWLPDPAGAPVANVPDWLVAAVRDDAAGIARHYLCFEVGGWSEDLVVTVPVHASLVGGLLYLEFWAFVLPPVHPAYRQCDWILPTPEVFDAVLSVSVRWAAEMMAAVRTLLRRVRDARRRWASSDEVATAVRHRRPVAHGSRISLRRLAARTVPAEAGRSERESTGESYARRISGYDQLFQYSDVQRICRTAEKQVLDAVLDLLAAKGLDVGEFRAFQGSRISVTNFGGTMTIGSIGERSRGTVWGALPPAPVPGS